MSFFVKPVPDAEATGKLREFYDEDLKEDGFVSNTTPRSA